MTAPSSEEEPLAGGNSAAAVVRVGNTVRREVTKASAGIHALLRHLEARGFAHSPRYLGIDGRGRERLTFHPGKTAWELGLAFPTDEEIARLGEVIRDLHEMLRDFRPPR